MKSGSTLASLLALLLAACSHPEGPDVARGRRLATIMGCISCHGERLDGHLVQEDAQFALVWSSNLSRILPGWTDAQLERSLRSGKRPDGTALWLMPTFAQQKLSPGDMRDLIAWLRTVPPSGERHPPIKFGPMFRQALAHGFADAAAEAARLSPRAPVALGPSHAAGQYLSSIACAECHGPDLKGAHDPQPGDPPDLLTAAAYSPADFRRLLRTGVKRDGSKAVLMGEEAPKRLSALTDAEIDQLFDYLVARAAAKRR